MCLCEPYVLNWALCVYNQVLRPCLVVMKDSSMSIILLFKKLKTYQDLYIFWVVVSSITLTITLCKSIDVSTVLSFPYMNMAWKSWKEDFGMKELPRLGPFNFKKRRGVQSFEKMLENLTVCKEFDLKT